MPRCVENFATGIETYREKGVRGYNEAMLRKRRHKAATVFGDVTKNNGKKKFMVAFDAEHAELDMADWSYPKFGDVLTSHMKDAIADAQTRPYHVLPHGRT